MANAISHNAWLKLHPRNMTRGAPMGQSDDNLDPDVKVHIEKLRWEDGDYTLDGTYWGIHGAQLTTIPWGQLRGVVLLIWPVAALLSVNLLFN